MSSFNPDQKSAWPAGHGELADNLSGPQTTAHGIG